MIGFSLAVTFGYIPVAGELCGQFSRGNHCLSRLTDEIVGQAASYLVVDAPNAAVAVSGKGDTFGAVIGKTVNSRQELGVQTSE